MSSRNLLAISLAALVSYGVTAIGLLAYMQAHVPVRPSFPDLQTHAIGLGAVLIAIYALPSLGYWVSWRRSNSLGVNYAVGGLILLGALCGMTALCGGFSDAIIRDAYLGCSAITAAGFFAGGVVLHWLHRDAAIDQPSAG